MAVAVGVGSAGVGDGSWLGVAAGVEPGPEGVGVLAVGSGFPPGRADEPAFPYPVIVTTAPAGAIATRAVHRPVGSRRWSTYTLTVIDSPGSSVPEDRLR